ncbi:MAG: hypothetical protein AB1742_14570 [bacterium]
MPGINPTGLLTNAESIAQTQLRMQQFERRTENLDFNPNSIRHTNPSIQDPGEVVQELTESLNLQTGSRLDIRI